MLTLLRIKNVALIDEMTIEFGDRLNIISGETGSGKSILLDSLGLCFGERGDKTLIRAGEEKLKASALFTNVSERVKNYLTSVGIECDTDVVLDREFDITGKSLARINGIPTTTATLKAVSALLADIHGQHEHQALISRDYQLQILDDFAGEKAKYYLDEINKYIDKVTDEKKELQLLGTSPQEREYLVNLYRYQVDEISGANIAEGELEELITKRNKMNAVEKIGLALQNSQTQLSGADGDGAVQKTVASARELSSIASIDETYQSLSDRLKNVEIELKDIYDELVAQANDLYYDPYEYERIDGRIDQIKSIFKKYGGDLTSVITYLDDTNKKLALLLTSQDRVEEIEKNIAGYEDKIYALQSQLSELRHQKAQELSSKIENEIKQLGIPNAKVVIDFYKTAEPYTRSGGEEVDFMFSANKGFEPRSLSKIISGGEMSRFMLAYKSTVAKLDDIDTLIFDEIDSGISGDVGKQVATKINALAQSKQIIAITHLPSIAAYSDTHLLVKKSSVGGLTHSSITKLDEVGVVNELSRMLGSNGRTEGLILAKTMRQEAIENKTHN